jgi:hypothetical protein
MSQDQSEKPAAYINPLWEIEISEKNEEGKTSIITKIPFCFMVHQYIKDYFKPELDQKPIPSPVIKLRIAPGSEAVLPLFLKELPEEGSQFNDKRK